MMPEKMYVLMVTWREVAMPALLSATFGGYDSRVKFTVHPAGVSTSSEKLRERAKELKRVFRSTFYEYQIIEVQVIDDANE